MTDDQLVTQSDRDATLEAPWQKAYKSHVSAHPCSNQHDDFIGGWNAATYYRLNHSPASAVGDIPDKMLLRDHKRMRAAGCNLAEAAIHVIREYDGLHRLSLAVAEWSTAVANEGDRALRSQPASGDAGEALILLDELAASQ